MQTYIVKIEYRDRRGLGVKQQNATVNATKSWVALVMVVLDFATKHSSYTILTVEVEEYH